MEWKLVAEGPFDSLSSKVGNMELKKGTQVKIEMDLKVPVAWAFDVCPNWGFPAPEGMNIVDVYGEGWSKGVVIMEADPAWLLPALEFIAANWTKIALAAFLLGLIVTMIRFFVWLTGPAWSGFTSLLIIAAIIIGAAIVVPKVLPKKKEEAKSEGP